MKSLMKGLVFILCYPIAMLLYEILSEVCMSRLHKTKWYHTICGKKYIKPDEKSNGINMRIGFYEK
jgi:hypothetical protein